MEEWLSQKGVVIKNLDGSYTVGWSTLTQTVNSLSGRVTQVENSVGQGGGTIDYSVLSAALYSYIEDHKAESGMEATWGNFLVDDSGEIALLEWLNSTVKVEAGQLKVFRNNQWVTLQNATAASLYSNAASYDPTDHTRLTAAEAKVGTLVEEIPTNDPAYDSNIGGTQYRATSTLTSWIAGGNTTSTAGFITVADLAHAFGAQYASVNDTIASVNTLVTKDPATGALDSSVTISANKVNITTDFVNALGAQMVVSQLSAANTTYNNTVVVNSDGFTITAPTSGNNNINMHNMSCAGYFSFGQGALQYNGGNKIQVGTSQVSKNIDVFGEVYANAVKYSDSATASLGLGASAISLSGTTTSILGNSSVTIGASAAANNLTNDITINGDDLILNTETVKTNGNISFTKGSGGWIGASNDTHITFVESNGSGVITLSASQILNGSGGTISSDENLKTIHGTVNVAIEDIANTRIVDFEYNNYPGINHAGTIAQDWQTIVPNAVTEYNHDLYLDYNAISIVSAVTAAREIVALKEENAQLKQRLDAIEARLQLLENA